MTGYTTGTGNRLETDGVWNFVYNDEGNMTEKENISSGELWSYFFDHNNRLTKVERQESSTDPVDLRVEFKYDVLGNRIEKSVDPDGDGTDPAIVQKFAYDRHGNAWADLGDQSSLTTRRLYEEAVDMAIALFNDSGDAYWLLIDHQGTIRDVLDDTGDPINHRRWDAYGNLLSDTGGFSDRYGWTGREVDVEINLQYNRARYYDPSIGRWISEDPIGFEAGDGNLYRYVRNNATLHADPSGLQPEPRFIRINDQKVLGTTPEAAIGRAIGTGISGAVKGIASAFSIKKDLVFLMSRPSEFYGRVPWFSPVYVPHHFIAVFRVDGSVVTFSFDGRWWTNHRHDQAAARHSMYWTKEYWPGLTLKHVQSALADRREKDNAGGHGGVVHNCWSQARMLLLDANKLAGEPYGKWGPPRTLIDGATIDGKVRRAMP